MPTGGGQSDGLTIPESPREMARTTHDLRMRQTPGVDAEIIKVIPPGETVELTGAVQNVSGTDWFEVTYDSRTGWVSGSFLDFGNSNAIARLEDNSCSLGQVFV